MPVFDVTRVVAHSDSVYDRFENRRKNIGAMVGWLSENVGEYFGPGSDPSGDPRIDDRKGHAVLYIGSGWQLEREWRGIPGGYMEVWWKVDITDEAKATIFALKWIK